MGPAAGMIDLYLRAVGSVLVVVAAWPANRIVWRYRRVPWRSSELGRVLHSKSLSIAIVLDLALVGSVFLLLGERPAWLELLRLAAFSYVAVALWRQDRAYSHILAQAGAAGAHGRHRDIEGGTT